MNGGARRCVECGNEFVRQSSLSRAITCSRKCADERHRKQTRERSRSERSLDYLTPEMDEVRALRELLAPLDAVVRNQHQAKRVGFFR